MGEQLGLYPDYDVLAHKDEWDENTRQVVLSRLGPFQYKLLSGWELEMVQTVAGHLTYENRPEILAWIAAHVDHELSQAQGEGQRQPEVPPQKDLVLRGLKALESWAEELYKKGFLELNVQEQLQILQSLQLGKLQVAGEWNAALQKALFKKLVGLAVDAYYSHPWVWSEIGYGGPAYPRGYVRIELGVTDPWEPRRCEEGI